jgi:DNA-binding NtrC family response regulator
MAAERPPLPSKKPVGAANSGAAAAPVTVLAIGAGRVIHDLRRILGHSHWNVQSCADVAETRARLSTLGPAVLVSETVLADGTWKDVLSHASRLPAPPPVIVAASHADDALWMEVLNAGGYNLLGHPFDGHEVFRVVSAAWLRHKDFGSATRSAAL